jgi:hypothetical protein
VYTHPRRPEPAPWYWPISEYTDKDGGHKAWVDGRTRWARDIYGQGYLLYLAYGARWTGGGGHSLYWWGQQNFTTAPKSSIGQGRNLANWETQGVAAGSPLPTTPFAWGRPTATLATFTSNIHASIDRGVPAAVAVYTAVQQDASTAAWSQGLPSWKAADPKTLKFPYKSLCLPNWKTTDCTHMHAVAVIGYDGSFLYYVDTCSQHTWPDYGTGSPTTSVRCRGATVNDTAALKQSGYANVWKISTKLLWKLMRQQTTKAGGHLGGYYYFGSNAFLYLRHPAR